MDVVCKMSARLNAFALLVPLKLVEVLRGKGGDRS